MNLIKILTILANFALLAYFVLWAISDGLPDDNIPLFLGFPILLLLNMYFLISSKGNDWLSLWFKRKGLEEQKRIRALEDREKK